MNQIESLSRAYSDPAQSTGAEIPDVSSVQGSFHAGTLPIVGEIAVLLPNGSAVDHQPTENHDPQDTLIESARRAVERVNGTLTGRVNGEEVHKGDLIRVKQDLRRLKLQRATGALTPEEFDKANSALNKKKKELRIALRRKRKDATAQNGEVVFPDGQHSAEIEPITVFSRQPENTIVSDHRQNHGSLSKEEVLKQLQLLNAERKARIIARVEYTREHQRLVKLLHSS